MDKEAEKISGETWNSRSQHDTEENGDVVCTEFELNDKAVAQESKEGTSSGVEEVDLGFQDITGSSPNNIYVGKRNFIHQLMDVALMMANVSQLKALLVAHNNEYFAVLLTFICLSITLQVVFTICMLAIWSIEKKLESKTAENPAALESKDEQLKTWAERLDRLGNVLVLFIIVSNVFVTGFGVEDQGADNSGSNIVTEAAK